MQYTVDTKRKKKIKKRHRLKLNQRLMFFFSQTKGDDVCAPFSPILMLLGKLELEPKHIPSKLVQRMVKLRCIFPFALAKGKRAEIQAQVLSVCEVKSPRFSSTPIASPQSSICTDIDSTARQLSQWREEAPFSLFFSLSLLMLSCPWLLLYETENDFSISRTAKNKPVLEKKQQPKKLLNLKTILMYCLLP